jgi:hypothetical protein
MEAMKQDIKAYLEDEFEYRYNDIDRDELEQELHDDLFINDNVTGNASGSYTFCSATAKEYVIDNVDLCKEALNEFCVDSSEVTDHFLSEDWEYFDVTIRCYLLGQAIAEVLEEMGV